MPIRQRDTQDVNAALGEIDNALFELQAIYDDSQKEGYTVTEAPYGDEQENAQQALINMMQAADALVGEMDVFIDQDGNEIPLPNPPLERGADGLPKFPPESGGG